MPGILPPAERRSVVLVATYAALSLLLLVVGERLPTVWLRGVGAFVFEPFDRVVLTGDRLFAAWRENTALHEQIARLEIETARLRTEGAENHRLREQYGLPDWRGMPMRPVEILALGGDPMPTTATLSAGSNGGVHVGDALMTRDGLVGRVTEVWPRLSRASLLTDPNLAVACEVETTGVHGILRTAPGPRPRLILTAVPLMDTILAGQAVITSNLSVRFPRGIPVGRVRAARQDRAGLMQEVELEPAARLSRLRQAFVVPGPVLPADGTPRPHVEFEPRRTPLPPAAIQAMARRDSMAGYRAAAAHRDSVARRRPAPAPGGAQ